MYVIATLPVAADWTVPAFKPAVQSSDEEEEEAQVVQYDASQRPCNCVNLNAIRVTRDHIMQWLNEPYFNDAVMHRFVRFKIGEQKSRPGKPPKAIYRICQITGTDAKPRY